MKETVANPRLDRELESIMYGSPPPPPHINLYCDSELELPDPDVLAQTQHLAAIDRLNEDKSLYPKFHTLESVHEMTGSFAPEELLVIAGDVGNGKSMLCQNLFDDQIRHEVPTLYIGTEQSPEVLKIKHACIRCGVSPRLMLKPEDDDVNTMAYEAAMDAVQTELNWINSPEIRGLAFYATTEYVNRLELTKWISGGVKEYGIEFYIVDHIDQVDHGSGSNAVSELTQTLQLLHNLNRQHKMAGAIASQIKRRQDALAKHSPPDVSDLAGAAGKERIMAIGLGVWRPLRIDLSIKQLRELKKETSLGRQSGDRIYQSDTMGVRLLKDRLGVCPGKQVYLHVGKGGKLSDDPATTHGIRTGALP
jgi:KaiC/GvpD/RAD55 family RecA-like ATPase